MAIPKKGSRSLTVDGATYRWRVRSRPTHLQAVAQTPMTFAVELAEGGQSTLVVYMATPRPDNRVAPLKTSVTPATVERAIRQALEDGWQPARPGSAFEIRRFVAESD